MSFARVLSMPLSQLFGRRSVPQRRQAGRPRVGSTIFCSRFRMTVPAGFNEDLWQWLVAQGWQPLADNASRYRYRALPSNVVAALVDAPQEQRERLLALALRRALDQPAAAQPAPVEAA